MDSSVLESCLVNGYVIPESIVFVETLKSCYITFANIKNAKEFYRSHKAELFIVDKNYKMEYSSAGKILEIQKENTQSNVEEDKNDLKNYHLDWLCSTVSNIFYI